MLVGLSARADEEDVYGFWSGKKNDTGERCAGQQAREGRRRRRRLNVERTYIFFLEMERIFKFLS